MMKQKNEVVRFAPKTSCAPDWEWIGEAESLGEVVMVACTKVEVVGIEKDGWI
jgi:hypothetical protein